MHLLNLAMKYYEQMEVIPLYQSVIMIVWILTGLWIMDGAANYSWSKLSGIFVGIIICCAGIRVLMNKQREKEKCNNLVMIPETDDEEESVWHGLQRKPSARSFDGDSYSRYGSHLTKSRSNLDLISFSSQNQSRFDDNYMRLNWEGVAAMWNPNGVTLLSNTI